MNYIVAVLLLVILDVELTFWAFYDIMERQKWRNCYLDGTPKLHEMVKKIEDQLKSTVPLVCEHLEKEEIMLTGVVSHYLMTCFS